jgi:plastocyanin
MRLRRLGVRTLLVALGLAIGLAGGATYAAFFATTSNSGNSISAAPDWTPPSASASVIMRNGGNVPGYIRQGAQYYVYAAVTDSGNPPSGVATVTANVSNITTGQTAAALTAGSWTIAGVTYNYRSARLTANGTLTEGAKTYTLTMTDALGYSATQSGFSVTVDNTAPRGSDIQTANFGSTVGRAEPGDTVTFTFSETMDPNTILAGWDGSATTVTVHFTNNGTSDRLYIYDAAGATQLNLGTVRLGRTDYVTGTVNFSGSTMEQSGSVITVTLGPTIDFPTRVTTAGGNGTMRWTPSNAALDPASNACSTANVNEGGTADREF